MLAAVLLLFVLLADPREPSLVPFTLELLGDFSLGGLRSWELKKQEES